MMMAMGTATYLERNKIAGLKTTTTVKSTDELTSSMSAFDSVHGTK
jgi:hypothetical protein